jgi:hypothetical protein
MIGLIGEAKRRERLAKRFGEARLECLLEAVELVPFACVVPSLPGSLPFRLPCRSCRLSLDV